MDVTIQETPTPLHPLNGGSRRDGSMGLPHEPVPQTDPHVDELRELVEPIRALALPKTLRPRACVECHVGVWAGVVVGLAIFCVECAQKIGSAGRDAETLAEFRQRCEHYVEQPVGSSGETFKRVYFWDEVGRCLLCGGARCDQCDGTGIFDRSDEAHELRERRLDCEGTGVWP